MSETNGCDDILEWARNWADDQRTRNMMANPPVMRGKILPACMVVLTGVVLAAITGLVLMGVLR